MPASKFSFSGPTSTTRGATLEGLQGTNLPEANLTQWASYMQDVASWMWKPPCAATDCPNQDIAGVLHRLENLTGVGFCCLCYTLGAIVDAQGQHIRPLTVMGVRLYGFHPSPVMPQWHHQRSPLLAPP